MDSKDRVSVRYMAAGSTQKTKQTHCITVRGSLQNTQTETAASHIATKLLSGLEHNYNTGSTLLTACQSTCVTSRDWHVTGL